jgi:hypothetical protein
MAGLKYYSFKASKQESQVTATVHDWFRNSVSVTNGSSLPEQIGFYKLVVSLHSQLGENITKSISSAVTIMAHQKSFIGCPVKLCLVLCF